MTGFFARTTVRPRQVICLALVGATFLGCATTDRDRHTNNGEVMKDDKVSVTRRAVIPGSAKEVFLFIAAQDVLPKILTGYGPLPAVLGTSDVTGPWDTPGSSRIVHLADASTVREQVTDYDFAKYFAYKTSDFGNPLLGSLATGATGQWTFRQTAEGTAVEWTYTFKAKSKLKAIPLAAIARFLWKGYMDVCLRNTIRIMRNGSPQHVG